MFAGNPRLALHVLWQVRLDSGQHGLEALDVARNDMALVEEVMATVEVAHQAAASWISSTPAAMSHSDRPDSQKASKRPAAT